MTEAPTQTDQPSHASSVLPFVVAVAGWAVPGLGHLFLKRWGRAATFFIAISGLALIGYGVRGNVFPFNPADFRGDIFSFLGSLADLGSGIFYFLAKVFEPLGPNVARAAGDYGTRFIATAGMLNLLGVLDAYEIASRKKE